MAFSLPLRLLGVELSELPDRSGAPAQHERLHQRKPGGRSLGICTHRRMVCPLTFCLEQLYKERTHQASCSRTRCTFPWISCTQKVVALVFLRWSKHMGRESSSKDPMACPKGSEGRRLSSRGTRRSATQPARTAQMSQVPGLLDIDTTRA